VALPIRKPLFAIFDARLGELTASILLPIFLAVSGLATDFRQLTGDAILGLVVLVLAGIASKWVGGAALARAGGLTWAEGNVIGVLMNCRGLLVLVVALVGVKAGIITPVMQLGAVLMALITTAMTGPLFDATLGKVPVKVDR
jgi:Kef-type K+ transport system membrane component KefB